jgi:hypothetical protein
MGQRQTEADRGTVIEDVDGEPPQAQHFREAADHLADVLEGVGESVAVGLLGHAEAGQVRGDDVKLAGQIRDQVAKHVAGAREAVQQQHDWSTRVASRTVEHLEAIDVDGIEANSHYSVSWQCSGYVRSVRPSRAAVKFEKQPPVQWKG